MAKKIIILSIVMLVLNIVNAQIPNLIDQKLVDSLFQVLPKTEGTSKVDVLNQLALNLAPRSYDSSYQYAIEALNLSEKLEYQKGKGIAIFNIGNSYYFTADYKNVMLNYLKALKILESFEPHKELGDLLFMLGALNQYINNLEKAQHYYLLAARNFSEINDSATTVNIYQYLGMTYMQKLAAIINTDTALANKLMNQMMDSAIKYYDIAIDYYLRILPDKNGKCTKEDLANAYNALGQWYLTKTDPAGLYDSIGIEYLLKGLEAAHEIKDTRAKNGLEGMCYSNLGYNYYFQSKYLEKGIEYAKIGAEILKKTKFVDQYAFVLNTLGDIEMDKGNYTLSKKYLNLALSMSDTFLLIVDTVKVTDPTYRLYGALNMHRGRCDIYYSLVLLNKAMGDFESALFFRKKLEDERNILKQDETNRQMTGLQVNFEDELQNQRLAMTAQENELNKLKLSRARYLFTGFAVLTILCILIFFLIYNRKKMRSDQKALILEQKLLRSQMNPHFLFNSLSSIQNFIVAEKPDKASVYLSKFSKLVRNILDNSIEDYVSLEREISTIENYIELQKVRYAGKFDYRIKIDPEIDDESFMIPPMLAQPFIENAIEHGVKHRETKGHIDIRFTRKDHAVIFEVEDNGVGREKAKEFESLSSEGHRSMSTYITKERLTALNKKLQRKITLDITDLRNESGDPAGTLVTFGLPL
jgi:tetratricopeptide (TPR) repeat protein